MAQTILVVDDEPEIVRLVRAYLEDTGYRVVTGGDGQEALHVARREKPDLVVVDVMMPRKSGLVMFSQLKKDERSKDIPVLMLTGVSGLLEEQEAQAADETSERPYDSLRESLKRVIRGMRADGLVKPEMFVDKPVDIPAFVAKVQQLIGS